MLLSRRWLARHALLLAAVTVFALLGRWQLGRAEGGNGRSIGYAFEWPLFALFAVYWWGRTIHAERHPPAEAAGAAGAGEPGEGADERPSAGAAVEEEPDEELDAYNRYLALLYEQDQSSLRDHRPAR
jgi:hypothetical protein